MTDVAQATEDKATSAIHRVTDGALWGGVLRFGLPGAIGMVLYTVFNLVDMYMVSRLDNGSAALAALAICDMVAAVATIVSNGVSTGTTAMLAQRLGARDAEGARSIVAQSLLLVVGLSVAFGLLGTAGSDFVVRDVMQGKGEAADIAVPYLRIMLGGGYSIFLLLQVTAILRALGHAKSSAVILVSGNLLNVVLNVFLIYGQGPHPSGFGWALPIAQTLGVPRLGVEGAAWATLIGRTIPLLISLPLLVRYLGAGSLRLSMFVPHVPDLRRLFALAWPSSAQLVVRIGSVLVFIALINVYFTTPEDQTVLTAYGVCMRLETMALFVGMGWGAAASTFMGTNLGAGRRQRALAAGWIAAGYNLVFTAGLVSLYVFFTAEVVGFFDASPAVLVVAREYVLWVAPSYCLLAIGVVLSQAMTGAGATMTTMVLDSGVLLVVVIPAAILTVSGLGVPRTGLWTILGLGNALGALVFIVWYRRASFIQMPTAEVMPQSAVN